MTEWFGPTVIVSFLRFGEWSPYPTNTWPQMPGVSNKEKPLIRCPGQIRGNSLTLMPWWEDTKLQWISNIQAKPGVENGRSDSPFKLPSKPFW
jgi:hypothetical protein